jgi:hypothetical protein
MSTMLRVSGEEFDPDAFATGTALSICRIYRRGEPMFPRTQPAGRTYTISGMNIVVSEADFSEFPEQIEDATAFLRDHQAEIQRLGNFPGVESLTLDFGIERRDEALQCD